MPSSGGCSNYSCYKFKVDNIRPSCSRARPRARTWSDEGAENRRTVYWFTWHIQFIHPIVTLGCPFMSFILWNPHESPPHYDSLLQYECLALCTYDWVESWLEPSDSTTDRVSPCLIWFESSGVPWSLAVYRHATFSGVHHRYPRSVFTQYYTIILFEANSSDQ